MMNNLKTSIITKINNQSDTNCQTIITTIQSVFTSEWFFFVFLLYLYINLIMKTITKTKNLTKEELITKLEMIIERFEEGDDDIRPSDVINSVKTISQMRGFNEPEKTEVSYKEFRLDI